MAMFGKDPAQRNDSRGHAPSIEAALSIVAAGMRIIGARQVLLGRTGMVRGNIAAGEVVLGGTVEGSVAAAERLELQATATVTGDVDTRSIVVVEGARINGSVRMNVAVATEPLRLARGQ
jgi:cytoskeletal protein CcmA (bactofilin family)